ncbi:MAG TPA: peptide deformylase [Actinobacteria bacterium]|nr:peptide deformylase [Actinomycetota bacterium]
MAILTIREFGDLVLREKATQVEDIDKSLKKLVKNMADTMYDAPGIGLAAPQIGVLKKIFICDLGDGLQVYINPEIVSAEDETEEEEGCLSIPNIRVPVKRAKKVKIAALNMDGKKVTFVADDLLARVFQHEVDHINGLVILDRTSGENKRKALRELSECSDKPAGGSY